MDDALNLYKFNVFGEQGLSTGRIDASVVVITAPEMHLNTASIHMLTVSVQSVET